MSIKQDYIEVENILNKDGEQTISLTGDQGIVISGTITSTVSSGTGRIRSGGTGQLHLGDDSDIISVGRTNELWCMADIDSDQTLYVNYRGYNNAATRFRSFDIRDGKGAQIALFNGTNKTTTLAGTLTIPSIIYHAGDSDTYIQFHNNDEFRVVTGGSERFEVTNSASTIHTNLYVNNPLTITAATNALFTHSSASAGKFHQFESYWATNMAGSTATYRFGDTVFPV